MLDKGEVILNTKYWQVALSHGQSYLGRCYVTLKRHAGDLADLSKDETLDFLNLVRKLENALRKAFNATMFNWACLMNNAYQEKKPEPHVHWHFKPRYREKVKFAGMIFEDPEFGHHYSRERRIEISEQIMKKIAEKIRENLK
jgi:diadenosine tetraphosphate (Ap4A) HIT family hydrolase